MTLLAFFFFRCYLSSSRSPFRYPVFETITPGQNPTGRDLVPGDIGVSLAICPPTSAVPHIFYRVRFCKARLADTRKSKQTPPGSQILRILHTSTLLGKGKDRGKTSNNVLYAHLFKTIESLS